MPVGNREDEGEVVAGSEKEQIGSVANVNNSSRRSGENAALHSQVETATQQMAEGAAAGLNTSSSNMNTSGVNLDVSRQEVSSQEQVAVIKCFRQEKQILTSRLEVVGAKSAQIASQLMRVSLLHT